MSSSYIIILINLYYNVCIEIDVEKSPCKFLESSHMAVLSEDSVGSKKMAIFLIKKKKLFLKNKVLLFQFHTLLFGFDQ